MAMTPMGTRIRRISRPSGRRRESTTRPTGSGSSAISRRARTSPAIRGGVSVRRSRKAAGRSVRHSRSCRLARRISSWRSPMAVAMARRAARRASPGPRWRIEAACWGSQDAGVWAGARTLTPQGEIVSVDDFLPYLRAQHGRHLGRPEAGDPGQLLAGIVDEAAAEFLPAAVPDGHGVPRLERPLHRQDAWREQALAPAQRLARAVVDDDRAAHREAEGEPPPPGRGGALRREEEGPEGLAREEAREGTPVGPAGDHRGDARLGGDAGRLDLGGHPADPLERRRAPGGPDDGRVDPVHHGDEAGPARAARV